MNCILNTNISPYFNLACEEYLLKNFTDEFFIIYRNEPCVVVGKHQNALAEINYRFIHKNNYKIIRRISGGGTVFHDLGNINYCFIRNGESNQLIDFKKHTAPIINILKHLNSNAELGKHNNIYIGENKISGNSENLFKNRVLHHGTLLFSSNLINLAKSLNLYSPLKPLEVTKRVEYQDKAIQSIPKNVVNIQDLLPKKMAINEFINYLFTNISESFENYHFYNLSDSDLLTINQLAETKYKTWEWNFAYSPNYVLEKEVLFRSNLIDVKIEVEKGMIKNTKFAIKHAVRSAGADADGCLMANFISDAKRDLLNCRHKFETIFEKLNTNHFSTHNIDIEEFVWLLF